VEPRDSGWYDCQVNTSPKISVKSYLQVLPRPLIHRDGGGGGGGGGAFRPRAMQDSPQVSAAAAAEAVFSSTSGKHKTFSLKF